MRRYLPPLIMTALFGAFALPALALDLTTLTQPEREAFRAEVRAYLLENPEVLMEAIAVLEDRRTQSEADRDLTLLRAEADALYNDPTSWVGGNPEGDITVVEFVDYRCGYCRKAHQEVMDLVASDGNIRLIMKEYPILGPDSVTSARFAVAVLQLGGAEAYARAHDALITMKAPPTPAVLDRLAADLGLDGARVLTQMNSADVSQVLADNSALGNRLSISGTPTFVVDETMVRGYVPLDAMRQIVAEQRATQ